MNSYFKFFFGILSGVILASFFYFLLFYLTLGSPVRGTSEWGALVKYKLDQGGSIKSPKLLLIGGSSVAYGLSAKEISSYLGINCYNFGFWGNLGIEYMLWNAKKTLKPGDTVLLCPEYEILDWPGYGVNWIDEKFTRFVASTDPDYVKRLPLKHQIELAFSVSPESILSGLRAWFNSTCFEEHPGIGLNQYGDTIINKAQNRPKGWESMPPSQAFISGLSDYPKGFYSIAEFAKWAKINNITLLASFPNLRKDDAYSQQRIEHLEKIITVFYIKNKIQVIGSLKAAMMDPECFFDTHYHLTDLYAIKRTRLLIPEIKKQLKTDGEG